MALPKTAADWHQQIRERNLEERSIYDGGSYSSASDIDIEQFLLLRVLYGFTETQDNLCKPKLRQIWIDDMAFNTAKTFLDKQGSWKDYIKSFGQSMQQSSKDGFPDLGTFSLVRYYQSVVQRDVNSDEFSRPKLDFTPIARRTRQALRRQASSSLQAPFPVTPTRPGRINSSHIANLVDMYEGFSTQSKAVAPTDSSPFPAIPEMLSPTSPLVCDDPTQFKAVQDEQIVNTALILFLNAISMHCGQVQADWTLYRRGFILGFAGDKVYEARVDGCLQTRQNSEVKAIVEVKPFLRSKKKHAIRMQEAAQVAAWISNHPPDIEKLRKENSKTRRLLVSQDRHEIYLTYAIFDADYVDYVCGRIPKQESFLKMREFGPFTTDNQEQMAFLGCFMLAFAIQECP